jgi:hypothetical protein
VERIVLLGPARNQEPPVGQEGLTRAKDVVGCERWGNEGTFFVVPNDTTKIVSGELCRIIAGTGELLPKVVDQVRR